jgi:hypothetical protein
MQHFVGDYGRLLVDVWVRIFFWIELSPTYQLVIEIWINLP